MTTFQNVCMATLFFVCGLISLGEIEAADPEKADGDNQRHGLQFDGRSSYVSVPNIPFDDWNTITVEAWVKDWTGRVFCQGKQGDPENSIWVSIRAKRHSSGWESLNGTNSSFSVMPNSLDGWDHVALVYDGQKQIFFLNGKIIHQVAATKPGPFNNERKLIIGAQEKWEDTQTKPAGLFGKGTMRLFRISHVPRYTKEFDPAETFKSDDDTVVLFDFSKSNDKTKLFDHSKNKQHGTIHDAKWVILKDEDKIHPNQPK